MSIVTMLWSMASAACITLAILHFMVWCRHPRLYAYLLFSVCAFSIAAIAMFELRLMFLDDVQQYGETMRWAHIPLFTMLFALVAFVYVHFQSGLLWLAIMAVGARFASLVFNFTEPVNVNFSKITEVAQLRLPWGEIVSFPKGVKNPLVLSAQLSSLFTMLFVVDASIRCWKKGQCVRGLWVGGSICGFILLAAGHSVLLHSGKIDSPYFITFPFLGTALAMGFELSSGILQATRLGARLETTQSDLRKSEQRLGVAADAANLGMWTWDIRRDHISMNQHAVDMIGCGVHEPTSLQDLLSFIRHLDRQRVRDAVETAIESRGEYNCEFGVGKNGKTDRWLAARGRIEISANGEPVYLHGVCVDVTERHQSEERFRVVFESAPNALVISNENGDIILANKEAERIFQYSRREMYERALKHLLPGYIQLSPDGHFPDATGGIPDNQNLLFDLLGRRQDGTNTVLEVGFTPIQTSAGSLVLASIFDVTERNEAERVATLQRSEIAHLSRVTMLGEVSGSIAHELNQPLTAIMTNAETAQRILTHDQPDITELNVILDEIVDDVARAAEVIRLLRVLQKKSDAEFREIDMHVIISDVARILSTEAAMRNVVINLDLPKDLPTVRGDKVQLEQVMINLLLNSFDAMNDTEQSGRIVMIGTTQLDSLMVAVSVSDAGIGLDEEALQRIFEPFYSSKPNGLGLGLAICKTIVEAHRGELAAISNSGRGLTVQFTLPCFALANKQSELLPA